MHSSPLKLSLLKNKINELIKQKQLKTNPEVIVVTKTFPMTKITPLINAGHIHFGENKIQEAEIKWIEAKKQNNDLKLHMIGKLQSNKAKKAIKLFDYIHSLDNAKLASKIFQYEKELNKKVKLFIQVNLADESQKSGIQLNDLSNFYNYCTRELSLHVIGLMCLPPMSENSEKYFKLLKEVAIKLNLKDLSMGMSEDFEDALVNGSTYLRIGTAILGKRNIIQ
tara:strand:+ start:3917 stop:4588 length:672 start_codon:yes stop_codon:yes gene_type:complete